MDSITQSEKGNLGFDHTLYIIYTIQSFVLTVYSTLAYENFYVHNINVKRVLRKRKYVCT